MFTRCKGLVLTLMMALLMSFCSRIISSYAFYPDRINIPDQSQLPAFVKDIDLVASDGTQLNALYLNHNKKDNSVILYFHGNAGNAYHRIPDAIELYKRGHNVLICEYRGYGRSEGSPDEDGVYLDARACWDFLQSQQGYPAGKIILYGRSLGTAVAIHTAVSTKPTAMILSAPFSSAYDIAKRSQMKLLAFFAIGSFDSISKIKKTTVPVLILHGDRDEIIPLESGQELFKMIAQTKEFVVIRGAAHNDLTQIDPRYYWDKIDAFINQHLDHH